MDPTIPDQPAAPGVDPAKMSAPGAAQAKPDTDPLVTTWFSRIKAAEKHWGKLHERMRHNRKLVRGIDDTADAKDPKYNQHRANLIQSTVTVVLSKVYAKNPEMSAQPRNKAQDLRLFADTVSGVTQAMLEDAKLKKKAKATVRAAMTCSYGVVKVQWQRDIREDPQIRDRIQDTQDNLTRIDSLLAQIKDDQARCDEESKQRELQETLAGLQAQREVVAAEGLVIDRVPSDRLLVDTAIEDIWEYESAGWMVEKNPMRKSYAQGLFKDFDLSTATTYKVGEVGDVKGEGRKRIYSPGQGASGDDDPIIMVYEAWSRQDQRIYTLVAGCTKQFARPPYTPQLCGERWWPYFILPFQSVDGEFSAQSLVDVLERLQEEHNETRDKFAQVRRNIRPHKVVSGDLKDKDITIMTHPEIGEIVVVNTNGAPLQGLVQEGTQLRIDPAVYDTSPIRNDWEMVSGLQDAARSIVVQPKTATEASISDQSLAARVAEFRDQIEDWLTEVAQYASEVCLLAMTPPMVETIMGAQPQPTPQSPNPKPAYYWPDQRTPDTVFNLIEMKIRAGSTVAPNKLQMQDSWSKALPLIRETVAMIRQLEAAGADATPERELLKETIARFDESIDVDRFLPPKPAPRPAIPPGMPGMAAGVPGAMPAAMGGPAGPAMPPNDPAAGMPHMNPGAGPLLQ